MSTPPSVSAPNPPITGLLRSITAVEVGVLVVAGGGLFFAPAVLGAIWPWPLTPFNTRFLGAIYLESVIAAAAVVWCARWAPTRVVLPMIALFTVIVLIDSLVYLDRFALRSTATWLWFVLYVGVPANALYHLWMYRGLRPADPAPPPPPLRAGLLAQAVALGLYGAGLLIAPRAFSGFWPWPVDDFHARMYSVAFLAPALGAWLLRRAAAAVELLTMGLTQLAGGTLAIAGLAVVDLAVRRVAWARTGTWLWIGLLALTALMGVWMTAASAGRPARQDRR